MTRWTSCVRVQGHAGGLAMAMAMAMVVVVVVLANVAAAGSSASQYRSVESIQERNIEILEETLPLGWRAFCESPVDEGVMSLYCGINPCDATIHVLTINNQTIELPIKALSQLADFDVSPKRRTLIYINAYFTAESYFGVHAHLRLLQAARRDLNIVIVDFARNLPQLYYAVRHHVEVQGYFVAKMVGALAASGIAPQNMTLAGHSVGANIAALGAELYMNGSTAAGRQIGQLIAVDPATMCTEADSYVRPHLAERVVVLHGEGDLFGVREPRGTIDIYPNGIGYYTRRRLQPGCTTNLCSHLYAFVLFMESLVEGVMIPAVSCDSWLQFRKGGCDYSDTVAIGLKYPPKAKGLYFCVTQPNPPFTFMEHGLKYIKTTS